MSDSQLDRPSRVARRGADAGRLFEAVDEVALSDLGAGELGLIARDLARRVGAQSTLLAVQDAAGASVEVLAAWDVVPGRDGLPLSAADRFLRRVLCSEQPVLEPFDPDRDDSLGVAASGARLTYAAGARLSLPGGPHGVLCAGFASLPDDRAMILWMLESCARLTSLCLLDRGALDGLLAGTQRDALTGCLNYAAIRHEAIREIRRSDRHGLSVSCCFIDLDGFRRVNGRYGHLHGNQVLESVAAALRSAVRSEDTLGRYGGDEFVLLLPDTDEADAVELAERVRSTIATTTINLPHDPIDASIGVAQWQPGSTAGDMLAAADHALLAAKAIGGGTVTPASDLPAASTPDDREPENGGSDLTESGGVHFADTALTGQCDQRQTASALIAVSAC